MFMTFTNKEILTWKSLKGYKLNDNDYKNRQLWEKKRERYLIIVQSNSKSLYSLHI